ncbi:MAG: hypothetical protein QOG19_3190 [Mycobacterium sp.]|jgi:hypothetical protein|nr:hypothetical protein [Mycobacterium sp.]
MVTHKKSLAMKLKQEQPAHGVSWTRYVSH